MRARGGAGEGASARLCRRSARGLLFALGLATLATGLLGCSSEERRPPGVKAKDRYLIGMSQCNLGEPWRAQMNEEIALAARAHPNLEVLYRDAQNEPLTQRAQVEALVALGIDLLIISPKEAGSLTEPVAAAYAKGIPVIVLDRELSGNQFTVFIGADNQAIGRFAGQWARRALGGQGNIVELTGLMASTPAQGRHAGFREGLEPEKNPGLQIVAQEDMQWLELSALRRMQVALVDHREIDLVFAHNDSGAHGAYLALRQADRKARIVGIDALPDEGVEYVKRGILDATFLYPTGGKEAIEMALSIFGGKAPPRKTVRLETRIYTRDNVESGGDVLR